MRSLPLFLSAVCFASLAIAGSLHAQALPTATRTLSPSAFVMGQGVFTGLAGSQQTSLLHGGKNLAVTLGGDLGVYAFSRYSVAVEARGTYPVDGGKIVSQKSVMGGVRIAQARLDRGVFSHVSPYLDVLFGRGSMNYQNGGYVVPGYNYTYSSSNVLSGGGGFEVDMTQKFSLKLDIQAQRWKTPVATSGTIYPLLGGVGVTYRFGAGDGPR